MNNKVKIIILLVLIVIITASVSWISFTIFYSKEPKIVNNLEIYFSSASKVEQDDNDTNSKFTLVNRNSQSINYRVIIKDKENVKNMIPRKYIDYKLKIGKKTIASGNLANIKDDTLLSGTIEADSKYNYTIEFEVDPYVDLEGKVYEFDLGVEPIM